MVLAYPTGLMRCGNPHVGFLTSKTAASSDINVLSYLFICRNFSGNVSKLFHDCTVSSPWNTVN